MSLNLSASRAAVGACVIAAASGPAAATGPLDTREMGLACESTLVDLDAAMLGLHFGPQYDRTMNYVSLVTTTGWQGRYWGTHAGKNVDIYYTGAIVPTGGPNNQHAISYMSDWSIDGLTGAGTGLATYTDSADLRQPSFSFNIDWINMTVSGSVSVSYGLANFSATGTKDFPNHTMSVNGHVGYADLPILGEAASADIDLTLDQQTGEYRSSLSAQVWFGIVRAQREINHGYIRKPRPENPPPVYVPPPRRPAPPPTYPYPTDYDNGGFSPGGEPAFTNNQVTDRTPAPAGVALAAIGLSLAARRRRAESTT